MSELYKHNASRILSMYSNNGSLFEKGGKRATLGEVRVYSDGTKWKKTSSGWENVKDIHTFRNEHPVNNGIQVHVTKVTPTHVHYDTHYPNGERRVGEGRSTHEEFRNTYKPHTIHHISDESDVKGVDHVKNYYKDGNEDSKSSQESTEDVQGLLKLANTKGLGQIEAITKLRILAAQKSGKVIHNLKEALEVLNKDSIDKKEDTVKESRFSPKDVVKKLENLRVSPSQHELDQIHQELNLPGSFFSQKQIQQIELERDYQHLRKKGYTNKEIQEIWDKDGNGNKLSDRG